MSFWIGTVIGVFGTRYYYTSSKKPSKRGKRESKEPPSSTFSLMMSGIKKIQEYFGDVNLSVIIPLLMRRIANIPLLTSSLPEIEGIDDFVLL